MRPAGEIRAAICDTLRAQGPLAYVDLVQKVSIQTTPAAISNTLENALRAGVIEKVGSEKRPHCAKWVAVYDVVDQDQIQNDSNCGLVVLSAAIGAWR